MKISLNELKNIYTLSGRFLIKNRSSIFFLFFFFILFGKVFSTLAIITALLVTIAKAFYSPPAKLSFKHHHLPVLVIIGIILSSYFINQNPDNKAYMEQQSIWLVFFIISVLTPNLGKYSSTAKYAIVLGTTIINLIIIINILAMYHSKGHLQLSNGPEVIEFTLIERVYVGLFNCVSLCILLFDKRLFKPKLWFTFLFPITINLILLNARFSLAMAVIIVTTYFFRLAITRKKTYLLLAPIFVALSLVVTFSLNQDLKHRLSSITTSEPRSVIWPCAIEQLQVSDINYWTGHWSHQETQNQLNTCYKEFSNTGSIWRWIYDDGFLYNTHNQYLDYLLSYGIIGLTALLALFIIGLYTAIKDKNWGHIMIWTTFFLAMFFENVLSRQYGLFLFVGLYFLLVDKAKSSASTTTQNSTI